MKKGAGGYVRVPFPIIHTFVKLNIILNFLGAHNATSKTENLENAPRQAPYPPQADGSGNRQVPEL